MKKIMFNDRYGLTNDVLNGIKTMTRRNYVPGKKSRYKVNDIVAVAQKYSDISTIFKGEYGDFRGWWNKMFVKSNFMPHHIKILNVELQRLQDISSVDCGKEGIISIAMEGDDHLEYGYFDTNKGYYITYPHAKEAYKNLIDKLGGKGSWDKNPLVWAYTFKLID